MYEYLLQTKLLTFFFALVAAFLACLLVGDFRRAPRAVAHNYGPSFACGFFLAGAFYDGNRRPWDLAAGLAFEFFVLVLYCMLLFDALKLIRYADKRSIDRWLFWTALLVVLLALPVIGREGFGIFSGGSRIDYLGEGGAPLYLTYASLLVIGVQAGLIAQRISLGGPIGKIGITVIVLNFVLSVLAGSKGSAFLWLASGLALVDYSRVRVRWSVVTVAVAALGGALWLTVSVVSGLLAISKTEFAELASARFFLNNDARALALDLGGGDDRVGELPEESFRGVYARLGHAPQDPPLGQLLYEIEFGISNGMGANSSAIALVHYYTLRSYSMVPVFFAGLALVCVYAGVVGLRRLMRGRQKKLAITLAGMLLLQNFSQDFLAFQVLLPVFFVAAALLLMFNPNRNRDHFQHPERRRGIAST